MRAVWFDGAMGLLDDAIRDHLELKRLRGADPGVVARAQKEALAPVFGEEHAVHEDPPAGPENLDPETNSEATPGGEATPVPAMSAENPATAPRPAARPDFSKVGQETAELDMRTVLEEHQEGVSEQASSDGPAIVGPVRGVRSVEGRQEDSLEWEVPEKASREASVDAGEQVPYTQKPPGP